MVSTITVCYFIETVFFYPSTRLIFVWVPYTKEKNVFFCFVIQISFHLWVHTEVFKLLFLLLSDSGCKGGETPAWWAGRVDLSACVKRFLVAHGSPAAILQFEQYNVILAASSLFELMFYSIAIS